MLLIGRDHRVSYANSLAHQMFGYAHGALHGASVEQLLAPTRRAEVRNVQAVLRGQTSRRWRSIVRAANGALIDANLNLEPCIDHRGSVIAVKVRCERLPRPQQPAARAFEAVSGTRPIPPHNDRWPAPKSVRAVPPPLDRRIPAKSDRPGPALPHSARPVSARPAPMPSEFPAPSFSGLRPVLKSERAQRALSEPPTTSYKPPLLALKSDRPLPALKSDRPQAAAFQHEPALPEQVEPPTVTYSDPPPVLASERKLAAAKVGATEDGAEQLETALQLLSWLRQRIEATDGPLADERERSRALIVLNETTDLVAQCRCDWKRDDHPRPTGR